MSYTLENKKELFLVTYHYKVCSDSHVIMSKGEVQEALKREDAYTIADIEELSITPVKKVSKKYFLPKNWEKYNPKSVVYHIWKEIAESEE